MEHSIIMSGNSKNLSGSASSQHGYPPQLHDKRMAMRLFFRLVMIAAFSAGGLALFSGHALAESTRKAISKEAPVYPSEALDEGINSGSVKVRLSIAADGTVTNVDILDAQPKGFFEKAVTRTLMRWKYEAGSAESIETQLTFKAR
jgi:protein TonB